MRQVAELLGEPDLVPKRRQGANGVERVRRRLLKLHAMRPGKWLQRVVVEERGMSRPRWLVNLSLLRSEHPELFEAPDPEDLEGRVDDVAERVRALELRSRAHGGALRRLDSEVRQIAQAMSVIAKRAPLVGG